MIVRCDLCGGENEIHPGQEILLCGYCGSSLALETRDAPEHLILPHERNDGHAELALRSLLTARKLARPADIKIEFSFVPYAIAGGSDGKARAVPAPGAPSWARPLPFPPAGNYSFFKKDLAGKEKVFDLRSVPEEARQLLHLPLYRIKYRAAGGKYDALVAGESLMTISDKFPPEVPAPASVPNMIAAACLFTVFLLIGRLASGWAARFVFVLLAASAGYVFFSLRERMIRNAG
jgi:hypothetical protein